MVEEEESQATQTEPEAGVSAEQEPEAAEAPPEEPGLTDILVERFAGELQSDGNDTYRRWGFALYHSLDDTAAQAERVRMGIKPVDALDHYNLGCHLASLEDFTKAANAFAKALELDPEFPEGHYNLALAREKAGQAAKATESYQRYLELIDDPEQSTEVKNHLSELANR